MQTIEHEELPAAQRLHPQFALWAVRAAFAIVIGGGIISLVPAGPGVTPSNAMAKSNVGGTPAPVSAVLSALPTVNPNARAASGGTDLQTENKKIEAVSLRESDWTDLPNAAPAPVRAASRTDFAPSRSAEPSQLEDTKLRARPAARKAATKFRDRPRASRTRARRPAMKLARGVGRVVRGVRRAFVRAF